MDMEKVVLVSAMTSSQALEDLMLFGCEADFYSTAHRRIYVVLRKLWASESPVNILTVTEELRVHEWLNSVGGPQYLVEMSEDVAASVNIEHYLKILRRYHTHRALLAEAQKIVSLVYDSEEPDSVLEKAQAGVFSVGDTKGRSVMDAVGTLSAAYLRETDVVPTGEMTGLPTGFEKLNVLTCGWQRGDWVVVAGRPSMGKTAFALCIAVTVARAGYKVAVFSLEQSKTQIIQRILCIDSGLSLVKVRSNNLDVREREALVAAAARTQEYGIWVNDESGLTPNEIIAHCRRLKRTQGLDMVIVDYIQLAKAEGESREQVVSNISRGLKGGAKSLDVVMVGVSQLSRQVEKEKNKEPQIWHLRDSGGIEQDADVIVMMYRPEYYGIHNVKVKHNDGSMSSRSMGGLGYAFVRKQRNGPVGDVEMHWNKSAVRYEEYKEDTWA